MTDFLDQFTKIDDLLRLSIRQQTLTNKLLAAMLVGSGQQDLEGVSLRDIAQQLNIKEILQADTYKTTVRNLVNIKTTRLTKKVLFHEEYGGTLGELYFLSEVSDSDNCAYKVKIISDNQVIYENSWSNFSIRSNYERDMTAFYDDNYYVLSFQNVAFNASLIIEIVGTSLSTATLYHIYAKIHQKLV